MNSNLSQPQNHALDDLAALMSRKMTTHIADELNKLNIAKKQPTSQVFNVAPKWTETGHNSPVYASTFPSTGSPLSPEQSAGQTAPDATDNETPSPPKKRRSRKQDQPQRSASRWDPTFQGVTLHFSTVLKHGRSDLTIRAVYHGNVNKRHGTGMRPKSVEESAPKSPRSFVPRHFIPNGSSSGKQCASCGTKKTPLWRDAEDGTPLCNACGIRYKKYRLRCTNCWHIPKKDSKVQSHCCHCGHLLKLAVFKYKVW